MVFLAGGTGFAPVKAIVEYTIHNRIHRPLAIYWGARDRGGLYLPDLPQQWTAQHAHIRYVPVLSEPDAGDAWDGRTGLVSTRPCSTTCRPLGLSGLCLRRTGHGRGGAAATCAPTACRPMSSLPTSSPTRRGNSPQGTRRDESAVSIFIRHEPVVNRQKAIIASRLVVHADSAGAAAAALSGVADIWPATHDVWVSVVGAAIDESLLAWRPPANTVLGLPARLLGTATGRALAARIEAAGTPLLLDDYDPAIEVPPATKFRFALADARRYPQLPSVPAVPIATGLADHHAFDAAVDRGYAGAAGWFFLRGLAPGSHKLNPSHAQIIHILNQVRQNADITEVETALKQNIGISFKLLRYINSAGFGLMKQIESFRHAVTLLGYVQAVHRQPEPGDPLEQPLQMRGVDDRPDDLRLAVMGAQRHAVERRRIAWSQFSFDHDAVARRRHATYHDARWPRYGRFGRRITQVIRGDRAGRAPQRARPHPLATSRPACGTARGRGS